MIAVFAVMFYSRCKHLCTGSRGDSIAVQTCCSTTVPCTSSYSSTRITVHSVPVSTAAASCADNPQAVLSAKRKRKFPGPAGALPKLVRNDMSNISLKKSQLLNSLHLYLMIKEVSQNFKQCFLSSSI